MKRFLIVLVIASAASSCSYFRKTANTETPANTGSVQPTYPVFTDANEALAEGKRLLDENQTEAAIDALHQAVKLNPDLAEAWFQLGIGYSLAELQMAQSGNVEEQPANVKERVKPNSEKAFEKAVEAYKKWIEANPKDDAAHYNLGRTYSKLMKDDEAEDAFREAVKLKPDDSDYQMELGAILIKLAKYREAIDPLKKAVELDPTNERAQELLEDAEAGRQRLDYVPPKNANSSNSQSSNSNSTSNANSNSTSTSNSNAVPRPTASNSKVTKEEPKKTPPANKPH
jgi:cytochrome c-type biogenesis protein CcmH/NrfG